MTADQPARIAVGQDHEVLVGRGLLDSPDALAALLRPALGARVQRTLIVHSAAVADLAQRVADAVRGTGATAVPALVPDAEAAKTPTVAAKLWARLGQAEFTRSDAVIGVGGGTVTDLAGFVAATWLRGIAVVQVPTTLAAMVDAAVGGKTGVNTAEGKNLVGAFHPPAGVLCDLDALLTLPRAELVAGMAEVVKHGFIADERTLQIVQADPAAALDPAGDALAELVERSVRVKASVVAADPRESFLREILNYGHTFGHAVEQVEGYTRRHGEAVAIGMVYAARLAWLAGRLGEDDVRRHLSVLSAVGLPTSYPAGRWADLHTAMRRDKKSRGSLLRFVVLDGIGRPGRLEGPSEQLLREAYDAVSEP